jgi:phage shock protein E
MLDVKFNFQQIAQRAKEYLADPQIQRIALVVLGLLVVAVVAFFVYRKWGSRADSAMRITADQANKSEFDVYLDVRTVEEVASTGTHPLATNIPLDYLEKDIKNEVPDKNDTILVFCNTGQRASKAADRLAALGYTNIRYISEQHTSLSVRKPEDVARVHFAPLPQQHDDQQQQQQQQQQQHHHDQQQQQQQQQQQHDDHTETGMPHTDGSVIA